MPQVATTVTPCVKTVEELRVIEISFYDHEYYSGKQLIATITHDDDLTQPWVVAVNELPVTEETLWLRILGRGETQRTAIDELLALPESNQLRQNTLKLITNLRVIIVQQQETLTEDEQELIMNLSPAYQQWEETTKQLGVQLERRQVVENLLRFRFGSVNEELSKVVDSLLQLAPDDFARFLLELSSLSREELLARFVSHG
jgi:flagellar motility protein MotE (MotC chaperone)